MIDPLVPQLIAARTRRGWSQERLAEKAGTTQATVSRLERGERRPSVALLRELADALGFDVRLVARG